MKVREICTEQIYYFHCCFPFCNLIGSGSCPQFELLRGRDGRDGREGEKGDPGILPVGGAVYTRWGNITKEYK